MIRQGGREKDREREGKRDRQRGVGERERIGGGRNGANWFVMYQSNS